MTYDYDRRAARTLEAKGNDLFDSKHEALWGRMVKLALKWGAMRPSDLSKELDRLRQAGKYGEVTPEQIKRAWELLKLAKADAKKMLKGLETLVSHLDESKLDARDMQDYKEAKQNAAFSKGITGKPRTDDIQDITYMAGFVLHPMGGLTALGNIRQNHKLW